MDFAKMTSLPVRPRPSNSRLGDTTDKKHFTQAEATKTLPLVKTVVTDILAAGQRLQWLSDKLGDAYETDAEVRQRIMELHELLCELESIGCSFKDWDFKIGIVDFPAIIDGEKVMLTWRGDEDEIRHYHRLDVGVEDRQLIPTECLREEPGEASPST